MFLSVLLAVSPCAHFPLSNLCMNAWHARKCTCVYRLTHCMQSIVYHAVTFMGTLSIPLSLSHTDTASLSVSLSLSLSRLSLCCGFLSVAAVFTVPLTPTFCLLCGDFSLSYLYNIYIYLSTLLQFLDIFLLSTLPFHLVLSMTILRFAERHWSKKYATCFLMPLLWELCWCAIKFWLLCLSA